ncbi:hypothetical protein [Corynebacterium auriscanis]|nr:hypothetical protein [Corynebacterium auriscanis]WJY71753.1 hypothetical protein CAURIC_00345 [Corynebacterium auriscanis]
MAAPKLFAEADAWFAERGYSREKCKEPTWVKTLGPDLEIYFDCDPIALSPDIFDTRIGFSARFPKLASFHASLHLPNSKKGKPIGIGKGAALTCKANNNTWLPDYEPLEASGAGPYWDEFYAMTAHALPGIEAELTAATDFRPSIKAGKYWQVDGFPFSDMLILLHLEQWDEAQRLLETTDWYHKLNPQNIRDYPNKTTTEEDVQHATRTLADYIETHRKDS